MWEILNTASEKHSTLIPIRLREWSLGASPSEKLCGRVCFSSQDKMGLERHLGERARKMVKAAALIDPVCSRVL